MLAGDLGHLAILARHRNIMGICKAGATNMHLHTVAGIAFGAALHLLRNNITRRFHDLWKRKPLGLAHGPKHWHGVVLHHASHRLTQCL